MKHKKILNEVIYLPEYIPGQLKRTLQMENANEILYWDFTKSVSEKVKLQILTLLSFIVKTIKDRDIRQYNYLVLLKKLLQYAEKSGLADILTMEMSHVLEYEDTLNDNIGKHCGSPKKFICFCRETLFLKSKKIEWTANVWYVEKLNITPSRLSQGNSIKSFSFLDVTNVENRTALQKYTKFLLELSDLNIGTIKTCFLQVKSFLNFLEEETKIISDVKQKDLWQYFSKLLSDDICAQSYNNKIKEIRNFIMYLQRCEIVDDFPVCADLYKKKAHQSGEKYLSIEEKIEIFIEHVYDFPKHLCIMSCILLYTGIEKCKLFQLKDSDFYYEKDASWMKIPGTNRAIPIPLALHYMVLKFVLNNHMKIDSYLFYDSNGNKYTYQSFRKEIMKQCFQQGILKDTYLFYGNTYQMEFCKFLYREGVSIQSIRDYMGYSTTNTVERKLGIIDETLLKASEEYFEKHGNVFARALLRSKHDKMNGSNQVHNKQETELVITEISNVEKEQVRTWLDEGTQKQSENNFVTIREEVRQMSFERQVAFYKKKMKELNLENHKLKKENEKLKASKKQNAW